jgi:hypothetical protein
MPCAGYAELEAYLWTYGVIATAIGSLIGMNALLHNMANARWEPFPNISFSTKDGSLSGSAALMAYVSGERQEGCEQQNSGH